MDRTSILQSLNCAWAATALGVSWTLGRAASSCCSTACIKDCFNLRDGLSSWKKNKNLDIGLYWLISVFGPGQVSVVGLADNPPPEFAEDQPKKTRKPTGTYFLKFFKVRGHPKVAPHPRTHAGAALRQITMHISTNDLY